MEQLPEEVIKDFFKGLPFSVKAKEKKAVPNINLTSKEKSVIPTLKRVYLFITLVSIAFSLLFIFLTVNYILYRVFSAACILCPAITFIIYLKYSSILQLLDKEKKTFKKDKINITLPVLQSCLALIIRSYNDFNITDYVALFGWVIAILLIVILLTIKFSKEYKRHKSLLLYVSIIALLYSSSSIIQINCLYDYSSPVVSSTTIIDKYVSGGKYSKYLVTVTLPEGEVQSISVSKEFYDTHEKGNTVTIVENQGLLNIPYIYIAEYE